MPSELQQQLIELAEGLRERLGLTVNEFVAKGGFTRQGWHKWVKGERVIQLESLERIARGLGRRLRIEFQGENDEADAVEGVNTSTRRVLAMMEKLSPAWQERVEKVVVKFLQGEWTEAEGVQDPSAAAAEIGSLRARRTSGNGPAQS